MPEYIDRGSNQSLIAPVALDGTQFYIFLIKGDKDSLQKFLDRIFNDPSSNNLKYEPFLDYVVVMFTHVERLASSQPNQGWAAYGDIAMWVPIIDKTNLIPQFKMYPAYMVVDNSSTMATGRETYGFPKEMGFFTQPHSPEFIGNFTVDVLGYKADNPTQQNIPNRLWQVVRETGNDDQPQFKQVEDLKTLFKEMETLVEELDQNLREEFWMGLNLLANLLSIPALGLQEIRDIQNVHQAAFQAIVEAPLSMKHFRSAKIFLDKYSFILNDLVTHPVAADTGLKIGPQDVVFAFWLYADFELGTGQVIQQIS
jgi:hypothetical protein